MRNLILGSLMFLPLVACDHSGSGLNPFPSGVTALTAVAQDPVTVRLFWTDNNPFESGYQIQRASSPFEVVGTVGPDTTTFTDTVPPRGTYRYRIRAFTGPFFGDFSPVVVVTPPLPPVPTLEAVVPDSGFEGCTTRVTVRGSGFTDFEPGASTVLFGGAPASQVNVVDNQTLTCDVPTTTTPALGDLDVDVANLNGAARLSPGFTLFEYPPYFPTTDTPVEEGPLASTGAALCCEGQNVYAAWVGDGDVYFSRSTDGGATWSQETQLDVLCACAGLAEQVKICCDGENIYVVWQDEDSGSGLSRIYLNRSVDGGASWLGDAEVGTYSSGSATARSGGGATAEYPSIACAGSSVFVAWLDTRDGRPHVYLSYSTDAAATWQPDARIDVDNNGNVAPVAPQLALSGTNVYVAWSDDRSEGDEIYVNRSVDGGSSWLAQTVRVDRSSNARSPHMAADDDNVYIAWLDRRALNQDVYFNYSTDAGASFAPVDQALETSTELAANVAICSAGDNVYVAWSQESLSQSTIHFARSTNAGGAFDPSMRLDSGLVPSSLPLLSCDGDFVFASWLEIRGDGFRVWLNSSCDGGETFNPGGEIPVSQDDLNVKGASLCSSGARAYSIFENGNRDIFMNYNVPDSGR